MAKKTEGGTTARSDGRPENPGAPSSTRIPGKAGATHALTERDKEERSVAESEIENSDYWLRSVACVLKAIGYRVPEESEDIDAEEAGRLAEAVEQTLLDDGVKDRFRVWLNNGQRFRALYASKMSQIDAIATALRAQGYEVPEHLADFAKLGKKEADALYAAAGKVPGVSGVAIGLFRARIAALLRKIGAESEETPDDEKVVALAALRDVERIARELIPDLLSGEFPPNRLSYIARKRISEIFRRLDGDDAFDPDVVLELLAQLAGKRGSVGHSAGTQLERPKAVSVLENEVAALLASGKPPEYYSARADRKEKPTEFLQRVYGKYLEKGREVLFLFQLRKLDPKFGKSLDTFCWKERISVENFIPTKKRLAERILDVVPDDVTQERIVRAVNAISRRRQLAAKKTDSD